MTPTPTLSLSNMHSSRHGDGLPPGQIFRDSYSGRLTYWKCLAGYPLQVPGWVPGEFSGSVGRPAKHSSLFVLHSIQLGSTGPINNLTAIGSMVAPCKYASIEGCNVVRKIVRASLLQCTWFKYLLQAISNIFWQVWRQCQSKISTLHSMRKVPLSK